MVWAFLRSLAGQLSNPDDEAYFQAKLYKNINPGTTKASIAATCRPNCAMHNISTSANSLPINIFENIYVDKDIVKFEDTCRGRELLFSSPVPVFYTHHTVHFLMVWKILFTFGLYHAFRGYWNHVAMILLVAIISIFLFGI